MTDPPRTALYIRLSVEDGNGAESESIGTQRKLLRRYAAERKWPVYREYIDDGYSGATLERPAFQQLLRDIEAGRIDLILTKDLSRLGRNSARTADLLDEYLPAHRVRCISVADGYDSAHRNGSAALAAPLMIAMHEMYARDISNKIRSALHTKMQSGEFIGSFAPYGYQKAPDDHHRLTPDPASMPVVQHIFALAHAGLSPAHIADDLNREHVLPPLAYRQASVSVSDAPTRWQASSVRKILKNPVYLGHTVQGKTEKLSFKSKIHQTMPPDRWITVEHTHPPLVSQELWDAVQQRLHARKQPHEKGFINRFSGLAFCASCGARMSSVGTRRKGSAAALACGAYKLHGRKACTNHHIAYETLYSAVLQALQSVFNRVDSNLLSQQLRQEPPRFFPATLVPIQLRQEDAALSAKLAQLYDDKYAGQIDLEAFTRLLRRYRLRQAAIRRALAEIPRETIGKPSPEQWRSLLYPSTLDPDILPLMVQSIRVYQAETEQGIRRQRIDVHFRFSCEEMLLHVSPESVLPLRKSPDK